MATSGDYRRGFTLGGRRYGHILDPRSGYPVSNDCHSVSVIVPSSVSAGVLSTAAFILGPDKGIELIESFPDVAACMVTAEGYRATKGFHDFVITTRGEH